MFSAGPPSKKTKFEPCSPLDITATISGSSNISKNKSNSEDNCSICLQSIVDRTLIPTCSHQFCFECVIIWSHQSRRCPLCSQALGPYLIHHIRSNHDYTKHHLTPLVSVLETSPHAARHRAQARANVSERAERERVRESEEADALERAVTKRRWIYQHNLYAKHVASNSYTRYRPCPTPAQFSASPDLISRMTVFLRRELRVWVNLDVEFLTTFTISLMKSIDIRSESAIRLLSEFLDMDRPSPHQDGARFSNAEHFAHEVYSYLRSPYRDLSVYDSVVQYDIPPDTPPPPAAQHSQRWSQTSHERARSRRRSQSKDRVGRTRTRRRSTSSSLSYSRSRSWSPSGRQRSPFPRRGRGVPSSSNERESSEGGLRKTSGGGRGEDKEPGRFSPRMENEIDVKSKRRDTPALRATSKPRSETRLHRHRKRTRSVESVLPQHVISDALPPRSSSPIRESEAIDKTLLPSGSKPGFGVRVKGDAGAGASAADSYVILPHVREDRDHPSFPALTPPTEFLAIKGKGRAEPVILSVIQPAPGRSAPTIRRRPSLKNAHRSLSESVRSHLRTPARAKVTQAVTAPVASAPSLLARLSDRVTNVPAARTNSKETAGRSCVPVMIVSRKQLPGTRALLESRPLIDCTHNPCSVPDVATAPISSDAICFPAFAANDSALLNSDDGDEIDEITPSGEIGLTDPTPKLSSDVRAKLLNRLLKEKQQLLRIPSNLGPGRDGCARGGAGSSGGPSSRSQLDPAPDHDGAADDNMHVHVDVGEDIRNAGSMGMAIAESAPDLDKEAKLRSRALLRVRLAAAKRGT